MQQPTVVHAGPSADSRSSTIANRHRSAIAISLRLLLLCAFAALQAGSRPHLARAQTAPLMLLAGWNDFTFLGPAQPVLAGLAPLSGKYDALWQFDAVHQQWLSFNPKAPEMSDFTDLAQGGAYWIHMVQPATLPVSQVGTLPGQGRALSAGWNNVGQAGSTAPVDTVLASYGAAYAAVWHWNAAAQHWEFFDPTIPQVSDFQNMEQGQAYFVNVVAIQPVAAAPTASSCHTFQTYQPQLAEVDAALNRAGDNTLIDDPSFHFTSLHTADNGGAAVVAGYVPPTILKSIAYIESGWRQATYSVSRGTMGQTITSRTCAYGLMQVLSGMHIDGQPTDRQNAIGSDYLHNIAAGVQILAGKWNLAPNALPVMGRRDPHIVEDWYFAIWAYHCYGDVCAHYGVHNNPDDPALQWPRPMYDSPNQQSSGGAFSATDYPYQEIVFGQIAYPPLREGVPAWQAIAIQLPPHGSIGFPVARDVNEVSAHWDNGQALPVASAPLSGSGMAAGPAATPAAVPPGTAPPPVTTPLPTLTPLGIAPQPTGTPPPSTPTPTPTPRRSTVLFPTAEE